MTVSPTARLATYSERAGLLGGEAGSAGSAGEQGAEHNPLEGGGGRYAGWKRGEGRRPPKTSRRCGCCCDLLGKCATWLLLRPVQVCRRALPSPLRSAPTCSPPFLRSGHRRF